MIAPKPHRMVWTSAPTQEVAENLVREVLMGHLAACAKIFPEVTSTYWWQGQLETTREFPILFKTHLEKIPNLMACIEAQHPYEVAECLSLPIEEGLPAYLQWIEQETTQDSTKA